MLFSKGTITKSVDLSFKDSNTSFIELNGILFNSCEYNSAAR